MTLTAKITSKQYTMMKYTICTMLLVFTISLQGQNRQTSFNILDLFPFVAGDTLVYQTGYTENRNTVLAFGYPKNNENEKVIKVIEGNSGNFQHQSLSINKGLLLHQVKINARDLVVFDQPILQLPPEINLGQKYSSKQSFRLVRNNEVIEKGIQEVDIQVLGTDAAMTPHDNYQNCIVMIIKTVRTFDNGEQTSIVTKQWYAPGVGMVKMAGNKTTNQSNPTKITMLIQDVKSRISMTRSKELATLVP